MNPYRHDPNYELKAILGTDKPSRYFKGTSFIDHIFDQLDDPERCDAVEVLAVFVIVDPSSGEALHYQHYFTTAESLVSAARTDISFCCINLKSLKRQIETYDDDPGRNDSPIKDGDDDDA